MSQSRKAAAHAFNAGSAEYLRNNKPRNLEAPVTDRELIAAVATVVMGWKAVEFVPEFKSPDHWPMFDRNQSKVYYTRVFEPRLWDPLTDMNAAMEVLGQFSAWELNATKLGRFLIEVWSGSESWHHASDNLGRAVCLAALRAKGVEV